jgi:glycosyltransferase involved in cell wall biosynthesis
VVGTPAPWLREWATVRDVVPTPAALATAWRAADRIVLLDGAGGIAPSLVTRLRRAGCRVAFWHRGAWRELGPDRERRVPAWYRWLARWTGRAKQLGRIRLQPPFQPEGPCGQWAPLPAMAAPAADEEVVLFEDGHPLLLEDCVHADIFEVGRGRYSVWGPGVYFAAPDGTDPNTNGREYTVAAVARAWQSLASMAVAEDDFAARFLTTAARRTGALSARRRVLMLIGSLSAGGAERQFCNLARGLVARGWQVAVASLAGFDGPAGHYLSLLHGTGVACLDASRPSAEFRPGALAGRETVALALLPGLPDLFGDSVWAVATHVAAWSPDVVHCGLDFANLIGALAAVAVDVPRIVLSVRNVNPTHFPYLDVPWFRRWYQRVAQVPGLVLSANSYAGGKDYAAWLELPAERFRVVHNGLDTTALHQPDPAEVAALRRAAAIAPGDPVVAGVFRLSAEKQPLLWLEVVELLRLHLPRLQAVHAGVGPEEASVKTAVAARGLDGAVHLLGRRSDPLVVLAAADLVLLCSTFEGNPNVLLEAQWLGRPVVCTAAGGSVEVLVDGVTGFVAKAATPAALAAACLRILTDPTLAAAMRAAGPAFIAAQFDAERMVDRTLELYEPSRTAE